MSPNIRSKIWALTARTLTKLQEAVCIQSVRLIKTSFVILLRMKRQWSRWCTSRKAQDLSFSLTCCQWILDCCKASTQSNIYQRLIVALLFSYFGNVDWKTTETCFFSRRVILCARNSRDMTGSRSRAFHYNYDCCSQLFKLVGLTSFALECGVIYLERQTWWWPPPGHAVVHCRPSAKPTSFNNVKEAAGLVSDRIGVDVDNLHVRAPGYVFSSLTWAAFNKTSSSAGLYWVADKRFLFCLQRDAKRLKA
jgi:hypothetical protein